MAGGSALLWAACALGALAVGVLRYAWSLPQRAAGWNATAWAALAAAIVCGWQEGGAWGVSIAALVTTSAAIVALAVAGVQSPPGRASPANRRAGVLPPPAEPRRIGRRVATFLIVIPGGFVASIALGLAMRGLATILGWGEANANVLALYTVPLAWAALATMLLMQARRRSQILTLVACGLAAAPLFLTGVGS